MEDARLGPLLLPLLLHVFPPWTLRRIFFSWLSSRSRGRLLSLMPLHKPTVPLVPRRFGTCSRAASPRPEAVTQHPNVTRVRARWRNARQAPICEDECAERRERSVHVHGAGVIWITNRTIYSSCRQSALLAVVCTESFSGGSGSSSASPNLNYSSVAKPCFPFSDGASPRRGGRTFRNKPFGSEGTNSPAGSSFH